MLYCRKIHLGVVRGLGLTQSSLLWGFPVQRESPSHHRFQYENCPLLNDLGAAEQNAVEYVRLKEDLVRRLTEGEQCISPLTMLSPANLGRIVSTHPGGYPYFMKLPFGGFLKWGYPLIAGWSISMGKSQSNMDEFGVPLF